MVRKIEVAIKNHAFYIIHTAFAYSAFAMTYSNLLQILHFAIDVKPTYYNTYTVVVLRKSVNKKERSSMLGLAGSSEHCRDPVNM